MSRFRFGGARQEGRVGDVKRGRDTVCKLKEKRKKKKEQNVEEKGEGREQKT